jgi:hypothetical protein
MLSFNRVFFHASLLCTYLTFAMAKQQRLPKSLQIQSTASSGSSDASKTAQPTKRKRKAISTPDVVSDDEQRPQKKSDGRQKVAKPVSGPKAETSTQ